MAFDFPSSPTVSQIYQGYSWDGEKWVGGAVTGNIYVADTAPTAPVGSLWWESDTGILYVRYNDGNSTQWVAIAGGNAFGGAVRYDAVQTLTSSQLIQARQNIYAAPFDAMAYNGIQENGSCEISQQNGTTAIVAGGGSATCDTWTAGGSRSGAAFQTAQWSAAPNTMPDGLSNSAYISITSGAFTTFGSGEYVLLQKKIEGFRCRRLMWGFGSARPVTISFWMFSGVAGTITLSVRNSAANRTYYKNIAVINGWGYYSVVVPGDTTGTWLIDSGIGMTITWGLGAGATLNAGTDGAWVAGATNITTSAASSNFFGTNGNAMHITGLTVIPGIEGPTAAQSALIQRPTDQELQLVQRYYEVGPEPQMYFPFASGLGAFYATVYFRAIKRALPTMALPVGWKYFNTSGGSVAFTPAFNVYPYAFNAQGTGFTNAGGLDGSGTWAADARI